MEWGRERWDGCSMEMDDGEEGEREREGCYTMTRLGQVWESRENRLWCASLWAFEVVMVGGCSHGGGVVEMAR